MPFPQDFIQVFRVMCPARFRRPLISHLKLHKEAALTTAMARDCVRMVFVSVILRLKAHLAKLAFVRTTATTTENATEQFVFVMPDGLVSIVHNANVRMVALAMVDVST